MNHLEAYQKEMQNKGIEATLLTGLTDVSWISGFSQDSAYVLVFPDEAYFLTDFRLIEQARQEILDGFELIETSDAVTEIKALLQKRGVSLLGIDYKTVYVDALLQYKKVLQVEFTDVSSIAESLRSIKDAEEIKLMKAGAQITQDLFYHLLGFVKQGVRERDLLSEMIYFMLKAGAEPSFSPIIASGENAAKPHAGVTDRRLCEGDFITLDFGVKFGGVCTDFTRTIALGGVAHEREIIYNIVKYAHKAALDCVRAGLPAKEADNAARRVIEKEGYGNCFGHGLGHGVGAEIHEYPRLNQSSEAILQPGMVVTIEPGIYLPNQTGVRIEDMVVITEEGCYDFYTVDTELIIL